MSTKVNSAPMKPHFQYIITNKHLFKCILHTEILSSKDHYVIP